MAVAEVMEEVEDAVQEIPMLARRTTPSTLQQIMVDLVVLANSLVCQHGLTTTQTNLSHKVYIDKYLSIVIFSLPF